MNDKGSVSKTTQPEILPDLEQMQQYVAIWRRRMAAQQAEAMRLGRSSPCGGQTNCHAVARPIFCHPGDFVRLAGKRRLCPGSDIDLAVAGVPKAEFFAALAAANTLAHTWVDLKPLEDLQPHFRQRVLETGVDLL